MDPWADEGGVGEPPTVVELNSVDDPFIMPPDSALKCSPKVTDEPVVTSSGNMANVRNNENKRNSGDGFVNRISQVAEIIHYEIECCDNVEANGQAVQRTNGYICSLPEEEKSLGSNAASIDTHGSEEDLIGASLSPTIDRPESCSALEGPEGNTAPGGTATQQESSKGGPTLRAPFACDAGGRQARTPPAVPAKPRRAAPPLAPPPPPPPPTDSAAPADEGDATEQTAPLPPRTRPSPPPPPPSTDKIAGCDVTPEETDASEDAEERLERANEDDEDDSGVVSGDEDSAAMDTARRARSGRPSTKPVIVEEHRKAAFLDVAPNGVANGVAEGAAECHVVFARRPQSPCQDCVEADADVSRPTPPGAALAGQTSEAVGAERPPCPADSALTPFAAGRGNAPEQEVHVAKVPGERTGSEANGRPPDGMEGDIFARVWNAVAEEEVAAAREGLVNGAGGAAEAAAREEGEAAALGDALHAAVARRDAALAEQLLRRGTSPDAPDWRASGEPPLLRAAANGDLACVRLLLAAGCAANARSALGETALHLAARGARGEGGAALLHALLQGGCDARLQCSLQGCSPLHVLCRRGPAPQDLPALEVLARASGAVDLRDHRSRTALHRLVEAGAPHTALYETLLRAGADASLQDARGETPLLAALQRSGGSGGGGPMAHVVALLAPRTDLARATAYGETALHLAARTDRPDLVRVLLQHGAPLDARDLRGNTALHLAAGRGFVRVAALLLAAAPAAAANAANADGCTPLHVAVDSGFVPVVQLMLEIEQCDLQARTHLGQTPLDLAQEEYRRRSTPQMALILLQAINKRQEVCTM